MSSRLLDYADIAALPTERMPAVRPPLVSRRITWPTWIDDHAQVLAGCDHLSMDDYLAKFVLRDLCERGGRDE